MASIGGGRRWGEEVGCGEKVSATREDVEKKGGLEGGKREEGKRMRRGDDEEQYMYQ